MELNHPITDSLNSEIKEATPTSLTMSPFYYDQFEAWNRSDESSRISPVLETMSPLAAHTLSSTSSSSTSLCLLNDYQHTSSNFLLNQTFYNLQSDMQINQNYTTPIWISQPVVNTNEFHSSKQDVSTGTEMSVVGKDSKLKKNFMWYQNSMNSMSVDENSAYPVNNQTPPGKFNYLTVGQQTSHNKPNPSTQNNVFKKHVESFKICEKLPPKKSRTKYSKEQIGFLEGAFEINQYPDQCLIEILCRNIGISKEKINIWFQNRRARDKRYKPVKGKSTLPVSDNPDQEHAPCSEPIVVENKLPTIFKPQATTDNVNANIVLDTEIQKSFPNGFMNQFFDSQESSSSSPSLNTFF